MKRDLLPMLNRYKATLSHKAQLLLQAPHTGPGARLDVASVGSPQLEILYLWHDGATPLKGRYATRGRDRHFLGWLWRLFSLDEALKRRGSWLGNERWQPGWLPLFVDLFNPRRYIAFDVAARDRPAVLQLKGATVEKYLADDLYGLFSPFVEATQKGWLTKEGFERMDRKKDFAALCDQHNPLAADAERSRKAGSLDQVVNGLLRCQTPSTPEAVENIVWRAEQVAKSDHPDATRALLQTYNALIDFGAAESIICALETRPRAEVCAAIVEEVLHDKRFEEAGLELIGLKAVNKPMFAHVDVVDGLLTAADSTRTPRKRNVARAILQCAFETHPLVQAYFERESSEKTKKKATKKKARRGRH